MPYLQGTLDNWRLSWKLLHFQPPVSVYWFLAYLARRTMWAIASTMCLSSIVVRKLFSNVFTETTGNIVTKLCFFNLAKNMAVITKNSILNIIQKQLGSAKIWRSKIVYHDELGLCRNFQKDPLTDEWVTVPEMDFSEFNICNFGNLLLNY